MFRYGVPVWFATSVSASINRTVPIGADMEMPIITFGICDHTTFLEMGGRSMDTAFSYGDDSQREVGDAVRASGVDRSELFVLTKIPCCTANDFWGVGVDGCGQQGRNPADDLQHDMDMLGLEYVDLMLMHWACDSMDDTVNVYKQMEQFMQSGKARAIGVSNFNAQMLDELMDQTTIKPAVNQVGFSIGNHKEHPEDIPSRQHWGCDDETFAKCKELGITLQAFSPLGGHGFYDVMHDPVVEAVASETSRSTAQVGLRWLAQQGIAFVTSSENPDHIQSDFEIFDFELTDDQMTRLSAVGAPAPAPPPGQYYPDVDGMCALDTSADSGSEPAMSGYGGGDYKAAWDGDVNSYFDYSQSNGGWTQATLDQPSVVAHIEFYPRDNFLDRHTGGRFVGITSSGQEVDLATISDQPNNSWNGLSVSASESIVAVKYNSPDGGYGNIAEIKAYSACSSVEAVV